MDQSQAKCVNCQHVSLADGSTIWVCQNCGTENPATDMSATMAAPAAAMEPTVAEPITSMPTPPPPAMPAAPATPVVPLDPTQVQPLQ